METSNHCYGKFIYHAFFYLITFPNDDVNRSQSTNDVYPTASRLSVLALTEPLCHAFDNLQAAFEERAIAFDSFPKVGLTQL